MESGIVEEFVRSIGKSKQMFSNQIVIASIRQYGLRCLRGRSPIDSELNRVFSEPHVENGR